MISYAAPGGGVGPHFDNYDVFLLQAPRQTPLAASARCATARARCSTTPT